MSAQQKIYQVVFSLVGGGTTTLEHGSLDGAAGTMLHFKAVLAKPLSKRSGVFVAEGPSMQVLTPSGVGDVPVLMVPHASVLAVKLLVVLRPNPDKTRHEDRDE